MSSFGGFGGFGQQNNNNAQQNTGFGGGGFGSNANNNNNTAGGMINLGAFLFAWALVSECNNEPASDCKGYNSH